MTYTLWRDVEIGEKTKKGDRCYGLNGWISMDHSHIQRQPVVVEGCYPIQRLIK